MQVIIPKAVKYSVTTNNQSNTTTTVTPVSYTNQIVTVDNNGGILTNTSGITLKNQLREIHSIQDIPDVSEVNIVNGATLVYNSSSDLYEVRQFTINDLDLTQQLEHIDGGSF
jgi:hypothetical protein